MTEIMSFVETISSFFQSLSPMVETDPSSANSNFIEDFVYKMVLRISMEKIGLYPDIAWILPRVCETISRWRESWTEEQTVRIVRRIYRACRLLDSFIKETQDTHKNREEEMEETYPRGQNMVTLLSNRIVEKLSSITAKDLVEMGLSFSSHVIAKDFDLKKKDEPGPSSSSSTSDLMKKVQEAIVKISGVLSSSKAESESEPVEPVELDELFSCSQKK